MDIGILLKVLDRTGGLLYYFVKVYYMEKAMNMRSKQYRINREGEPSGWKFFLILRTAQGSIGVLRMKIAGISSSQRERTVTSRSFMRLRYSLFDFVEGVELPGF
ncbi:MAG: hypothetical protein GX660_25390 [Clostridiaceae bacterium]|nr:hypothetical protein [Clostridiaceae bacterium]